MNTELIRRQERMLTDIPTVPTVANHTLSGWLDTDIYIGELAFVLIDGKRKVYSRDETGVFQIVRINELIDALATKLNIEDYNQHFRGKYISAHELNYIIPEGNDGDYAIVDAGAGEYASQYIWDKEDGWLKSISDISIADTDSVPEGNNNLYFTAQRVRNTLLNGLTPQLSRVNLEATDSVLEAFDKIYRYLADLHAISFSGSYNDLSDTPGIPSGTNDIDDASRFSDLTPHNLTETLNLINEILTSLSDAFRGETLEVVRLRGNIIYGDIKFNGYLAKSLGDAVDPGDAVNLKTLENYISETNVFDLQGEIDFSTPRDFPAAKRGMRWEVIGAGKPNGAPDEWMLEPWDEIVCKTTTLSGNFAAAGANWYFVKGRVNHATETTTGTAALARQAIAEAGTDDLTIMTPLKVAQKLAHWLTNALLANVHTWVSKQTFAAVPRFNSTTASQYLKVDSSKDLTSVASIPATDISGSKTSSFISDFASAVNTLISSAISALGLGNSATKNVGTAAGTVAAGDDARITGAMPAANVIAMQIASDQTTTSTSLVDVTDLSFSIAANENWIFDFNLQLGTSAANGLRVALSFPTGATLRAMQHGTNNSLSAFTSQMIDTNNSTSTSFQAVTTANGFMDIKGSIKNGSNAGTVKVRIQSQNAANTVTVFANSKGLAIKK